MRQAKIRISLLIVLVVGLHAVPALSPLWSPTLHKQMWPILEWSMYKRSRPAGPIYASKIELFGITQAGKQEEITPFMLGSSRLALRGLYLKPMWDGDTAAGKRLAWRINRGREDPFVEFRLVSAKYLVTDTGVAKTVNPTIAYRYDLLEVQ